MGSGDDEVVEIDSLEKGLLVHDGSGESPESKEDPVLYAATFQEMEDDFVKYQTAQWVLYSLLFILVWGIGLFMLLYLPVRRYILRKDIRSRKLYLTPNAIVYKKEKHVLLPLVADIVVEQGYLQSLFGVYSLRIENMGVRRPPSDDVQIQGVANPNAFRKAVLTRLSSMKNEAFSRQVSAKDDPTNLTLAPSSASWTLETYNSLFGVYSLRIENMGVRRPPSDDVQIQGVANPNAFRKAVLTRLSSMKNEAFSRQVSAKDDPTNLTLAPSSASWMSPSKSIQYDTVATTGEQLLLQRLEEVGTSVKRVETLIEEQYTQASASLE
ncbi:hypothetical protein CDL15_Pgr013271 [Punica granatum]|uniref:DUF7642 domain-containing protein n=1 Tax=Punica granatum TaxID=22663 RepID=A0A218WNC1_PUNGR|nr:hypothetical protein CDL15_Pgr013271 [Punica granatum]